MENKFLTLQTIYELVKDDSAPTSSIIHPNEIIVRQSLPWDEIVNHLRALQKDGFILFRQLSRAIVTITDKGLQYISTR